MRAPVDRSRIQAFLRALGDRFRRPGRIYLVGGTTIVLKGLRAVTADVDLTGEVAPEDHAAFIATLRLLKKELDLNIEEVSPAEFIPLPAGHGERAVFEGRFGSLDVFHFDPYSTALAKISRGTEKDLADVRSMLDARLLEWPQLEARFGETLATYGRDRLGQDPERFRRHFESVRRR